MSQNRQRLSYERPPVGDHGDPGGLGDEGAALDILRDLDPDDWQEAVELCRGQLERYMLEAQKRQPVVSIATYTSSTQELGRLRFARPIPMT